MMEWLQQHIPEILLIAFGFTAFVSITYYLLIFSRFSFHKAKPAKGYISEQPVSVVITARNEAHHLIKSLPQLLSQQYINYEIVVVNDNSTDETEQIIRDFMTQYPNLKLVNLTSSVTNIQGKKFPLSIGIKSASNDIILVTDANCIPSSPYWIQNMARHFKNKTKIVLGYGGYEKKKGFLNLLIHFDTLHTALQYFSYALAKMPYMGVGRNLGYTKSLFYEKRGFASHNHLMYGDDDIFINRAATTTNCDIEYSSNAYTIARPQSRFMSWFAQKRQHTATRKYYKSKHKFLLITYGLFALLFYVAFGFAIAYCASTLLLFIITGGIFVLKTGIQYLIFGKAAAKLDERAVIPHILLLDILFALINPFVTFTLLFMKRK